MIRTQALPTSYHIYDTQISVHTFTYINLSVPGYERLSVMAFFSALFVALPLDFF